MLTVAYSPGKLAWMTILCGLILPVMSPVMLATGPAAYIVIPIMVIGGPICALACLIRMLGSRRAVEIGPDRVVLKTLWRTVDAPVAELLAVRVEQETLMLFHVIPTTRQWRLAFVLRGGLRKERKIALQLNLLALDRRAAQRFAEEATARLQPALPDTRPRQDTLSAAPVPATGRLESNAEWEARMRALNEQTLR